mgnify:CR=1 FL=1
MIGSQPSLSLNRLIALAASFGLLFVGGLAMGLMFLPDGVRAESSTSQQATKLKGNILRGRDIFNGKGACYYCHGIDGYLTIKLLDDPSININQALDEFFKGYYGAAAEPMKKLYLAIEQTGWAKCPYCSAEYTLKK